MNGTNPTRTASPSRATPLVRLILTFAMACSMGAFAQSLDVHASNSETEAGDGTILKAFLGVSPNGNLQEALDEALSQADAFYLALPFISDQFYDYSIMETSGSRLGIAGVNTVRVRILTRGCCEVTPGSSAER